MTVNFGRYRMDNDQFSAIVMKTQDLLTKNTEWMQRYSSYSKSIIQNLPIIKDKKSKFNEWSKSNLFIYMNTTEAKSSMNFYLRYLGQDIAKLKIINNTVTISTKDFNDKNEKHFKYSVVLDDEDWTSTTAKELRKYFCDNPEINCLN